VTRRAHRGPSRRVLAGAVATALTLAGVLSSSYALGAVPAAARTTGWWHPGSAPIEWQWELDHPLHLSSPKDMGEGATTPSGNPAGNPTVYDIDGFQNPASTVAALHRAGDRVICYIEVGAAENYRPDYHEFLTRDLGKKVPGYPAERYLDIDSVRVRRIIEARIAMCHRKGFDGVEPDIDDSYSDDTGFTITEAANVAYDLALAAYAHHLGLAWGQKNGDNDPHFSRLVEPRADFLLDEQCFQYATCGIVAPPYLRARKAVFEVEYSLPRSRFCAQANGLEFNSMKMNVALAGGRQPCR